MSSPLTLSTTQPDFESIVLQLQLYLSAKGTWSDLLTSSTGETLIEMMGAVGAFNQFAIESAAREDFLDTAVRDSSIYAITDMLGVRISRKTPASVGAVLTRPASAATVSYPRFSAFTVGGAPYFNRDTVVFNANSTTSEPCVLYEGTINKQTVAADTTSFRKIYLNVLGFVVSDVDVDVYLVNNTTGQRALWSNTTDGIWIAGPFDTLYYDSTSGDGDTVLAFGDGTHGMLPTPGYSIEIDYAVTTGSRGNNGQSGLDVLYPLDSSIKGSTTSVITGGADEKPSSYYSALAPYIYRARGRAVNPTDYKAIATEYPGVASATIKGQKDIAPGDVRWMNVVRICILPEVEDQFSSIEWSAFLAYMDAYKHAAIQIQTYNPVKVVVDVNVTLALMATVAPTDVVPLVTSNITALFAKTTTTLGWRIPLSDITKACVVSGVDYVEVLTPTIDQIPADDYTYLSLGTLTVSTIYTTRSTV